MAGCPRRRGRRTRRGRARPTSPRRGEGPARRGPREGPRGPGPRSSPPRLPACPGAAGPLAPPAADRAPQPPRRAAAWPCAPSASSSGRPRRPGRRSSRAPRARPCRPRAGCSRALSAWRAPFPCPRPLAGPPSRHPSGSPRTLRLPCLPPPRRWWNASRAWQRLRLKLTLVAFHRIHKCFQRFLCSVLRNKTFMEIRGKFNLTCLHACNDKNGRHFSCPAFN